jgi:hypothetical protein
LHIRKTLCIKEMTKLHRSDFLREAKALFPSLREDLNRQEGLLHLEMDVFYRFAQAAIDDGNRETTLKAFQFAERILRHGNPDLVNAVTVSFLETLNLEDGKKARRWAKGLMPALVARQREAILEHNRELQARRHT